MSAVCEAQQQPISRYVHVQRIFAGVMANTQARVFETGKNDQELLQYTKATNAASL